ncbi:1-deoxy-D-xylulose-5-phosphate reductoisomerase [Falsirhodobacter sp. alg1]|uniref:1-deoxy-D-xylulose-5-phosphate reductoisomerase n=1 Tax=Falsirhodobacter sp. alg1 TaxID=1472418 RepID=UPI000786D401|nr:1-deoxy-D-xylulose-5-phosphate reductoisomerase [Falsirhodobacter sp. alg1]
MRSISIFGATGSIGESTFDLIRQQGGARAFRTVALTGGRNITRLAEMAVELQAEVAVTAHEDCLPSLRDALQGTGIEVQAGASAIAEAADRPADWVMSAIIGAAGLVPGLRALRHGRTLALANKESLVTAGALLMATAQESGATILPVDSEHSAVFQALTGEDIKAVEKVIITASGGPFRDWSVERIAKATLAEAVAHPSWSMGQRISIDSASMFNKALELIETREFFDIDPSRIDTLVHPQSIVHALVGFTDGGVLAHMGMPDMRHAIGYALHWPDRGHVPVARLDLGQIANLSFQSPDAVKFPALRLARDVMSQRGLYGAVFNAAKEIALDHFIAGRIAFPQMAAIVEETLVRVSAEPAYARPAARLDDVMAADSEARRIATAIVKEK